jgi:hypothetical protein
MATLTLYLDGVRVVSIPYNLKSKRKNYQLERKKVLKGMCPDLIARANTWEIVIEGVKSRPCGQAVSHPPSEVERKLIIRLKRQGYSIRQIEEMIGRGYRIVSRAIMDHQIGKATPLHKLLTPAKIITLSG